jgi:hypothetical protein
VKEALGRRGKKKRGERDDIKWRLSAIDQILFQPFSLCLEHRSQAIFQRPLLWSSREVLDNTAHLYPFFLYQDGEGPNSVYFVFNDTFDTYIATEQVTKEDMMRVVWGVRSVSLLQTLTID